MVISCRRPTDGGKWAGTEEQRQLLLRTAIAEGVEYIDLEDDMAAKVPRFGKTKRIVSFHDFRKTPDDLDDIHRRLSQCDADIVKISTMANHPSDNVRILDMVRKAKVPTIGLGMGDIGVPTRILAGKFGVAASPTPRSRSERALAPGQLSFEHMTQVYRYDQINAETEVYGVVADPIGHSLSPLIHNAAFAHFGLNKVYVPFRVPREDLGRFIDEAGALGIRGLSITIPHKEEVIKKLTRPPTTRSAASGRPTRWSSTARCGPATTPIIMPPCRAWRGHGAFFRRRKTALRQDGPGDGLRRRRHGHRLRPGPPRGPRAGQRHRSPQGRAVAGRFDCLAVDWADRHKANPDILVNCTPVGMHPNVDETPLRKAPPATLDGRFRRRLQSREHALDQGRPQPQLHGGDRASRCSSARPACNSSISPATTAPPS